LNLEKKLTEIEFGKNKTELEFGKQNLLSLNLDTRGSQMKNENAN